MGLGVFEFLEGVGSLLSLWMGLGVFGSLDGIGTVRFGADRGDRAAPLSCDVN